MQSEDDTICGICNCLFDDARDLECGHTFCLNCLKSSNNSKCFSCSTHYLTNADQSIDQLPKNEFISNLIHLINELKSQNQNMMCSRCSTNRGIFFCNQCKIYFCDTCEKLHASALVHS